MIQRFFAAAEGERPLGASDEFRHARSILPVSREDTIFAYFSAAFFRELVGPQYQVELARRIQSVADMEVVRMAQLAARAEKQPSATIDDLTRGGLLPQQFGQRPDGSRVVVVLTGCWTRCAGPAVRSPPSRTSKSRLRPPPKRLAWPIERPITQSIGGA